MSVPFGPVAVVASSTIFSAITTPAASVAAGVSIPEWIGAVVGAITGIVGVVILWRKMTANEEATRETRQAVAVNTTKVAEATERTAQLEGWARLVDSLQTQVSSQRAESLADRQSWGEELRQVHAALRQCESDRTTERAIASRELRDLAEKVTRLETQGGT